MLLSIQVFYVNLTKGLIIDIFCIYEAILNSDIKNLITFLKESNNIFKNKNIESIINELEKQTFNKTEIQPNKNVKSGMEGLVDLK